MLDRFPGVKLMSVENGGQWVHTLARNLELAFKKMPKEFPTHPLEVLRRNVWLNPFWEESVLGLVELMGPERVCFGSDYPHPEGMAEPLSFLDMAADLEPAVLERVMSTNMFDLMGLPRPVPATAQP